MSFLDRLIANKVTAQTATNAIVLAHHLYSLESNALLFIKYNTWDCPQGEGTLIPKIENGVAHDQADVEAVPTGVNFFNTELQEGEDIAPVAEHRDDKQEMAGGNNEIVPWACFLAAYSLRLFTKTQKNMVQSWGHMNTRYTSFFRSYATVPMEVPENSWVVLKSHLTDSRKLMTTWIKLVSMTENVLSPSEEDSGLLKYLATIVFAYSGMHAYSLFMHLHLKSRIPVDSLLNDMDTPATSDATLGIFTIATEYESNESVRRTPFFKYARLFGQQTVQTKACPEFVYLVVKLLKCYVDFKEEQDPINIVGLDAVSAYYKRFFDYMTKSIHDKNMKDDASQLNPHARAAANLCSAPGNDSEEVATGVVLF